MNCLYESYLNPTIQYEIGVMKSLKMELYKARLMNSVVVKSYWDEFNATDNFYSG